MEMSLFKKIIDEGSDYFELVSFSGGNGEPLLNPELPEMIGYCIQKDLRVLLSTNVTPLRSRIASKLINDFPPDIMIMSLDGATDRIHEQIRKGSKYERTVRNVYHFLDEKNKHIAKKPFVMVQMIVMPSNISDVPLFRKKWKGQEGLDLVRFKKFMSFYGADVKPVPDSIKHKAKLSSCILPWRQITISYDGKMSLCCLDNDFAHIVGSLKTSSIDELWNSKKMQEYRTILASGNRNKIAICEDCSAVKVNAVSGLGLVMLDYSTISKLMPVIESYLQKFDRELY
jgi:radical SAM protein with 4Fe4S-binding SPASM domain